MGFRGSEDGITSSVAAPLLQDFKRALRVTFTSARMCAPKFEVQKVFGGWAPRRTRANDDVNIHSCFESDILLGARVCQSVVMLLRSMYDI
jgi:hypothetical protein